MNWCEENNRWELTETSNIPELVEYTITEILDEEYGVTDVKLPASITITLGEATETTSENPETQSEAKRTWVNNQNFIIMGAIIMAGLAIIYLYRKNM